MTAKRTDAPSRLRMTGGVDALDLPSVRARLDHLARLSAHARPDVKPRAWKGGFDWAFSSPDGETFNLQQDPARLYVAVHRFPHRSAYSFECPVAEGSAMRRDGVGSLRALLRVWRAALRAPRDERLTIEPPNADENAIATTVAALLAAFGGESGERPERIRVLPPSPHRPGRVVGMVGNRDVLQPAAAAFALADEPATLMLAVEEQRRHVLSPDGDGRVVALPDLSTTEAMRAVRALPAALAVPTSLAPRFRR